jgi:hypothetical protein
MKKYCVGLVLCLVSGMALAGNAATNVVVLECGITFAPFSPENPFPVQDPGLNVITSSSSVTPPAVDLTPRGPCATALAGLIEAGYRVRDVQIFSGQLYYTLVAGGREQGGHDR